MGAFSRGSKAVKSYQNILISKFPSKFERLPGVLFRLPCVIFTATAAARRLNWTHSFSSLSRNEENRLDLAQLPPERIRNFSITAHTDRVKSSSAKRPLELSGTFTKGHGQPQYFDKLQDQLEDQGRAHDMTSDTRIAYRAPAGDNISKREKISFLVKTLLEISDSKEAIYGTLDAWVAWEQNFPIASLKNVMLSLEREQQWHRIVQVIKWILSKGQGNTMGTYQQLIRALDMDHRAQEAHQIWVKKIGHDLHSVPWKLCSVMISVYYRNNMLDNMIKLFKGLEAYGRHPPHKSIVQKVASAYEALGMIDDKERVLEKYSDLFIVERKASCKNPEKKHPTKG